MTQTTTRIPLASLESDFRAELQREGIHEPRSDFDATTAGAPTLEIPDYVEHRDGVTEIGKLTAEAVLREYEATVTEIESMSAQLIERIRQCEANTRNTLTVTHELRDIAARYREEAKIVFEQIESCSRLVAETRKTCAELKRRIGEARPARGPTQGSDQSRKRERGRREIEA